ncbi:HTTM domain-containing protein [Epibacterium ulvae]|uniref:HTTM domain-containing protein n=1 Tax=Epibacterium ulvae TaxID=1156985 RepID=UPI00249088BC|nr:HTTM domain-containing protein [Epibacterium ulvae]
MSFEDTLRLTELMLAFVIAHQSLEHLSVRHSPWLFGLRLVCCACLAIGVFGPVAVWGLWGISVLMLHRFQGPYNGGSDKMTILILSCVSLAHLAPNVFWAEMALAYLAVQLVLSYFVSGWIKIINPEWQSGRALSDVFRFSAYPVSEGLRDWADRRLVLFLMSWAVMLLEVLFPLTLLNAQALQLALLCTAAFHLSNACFFGLNRFFWIWLCAYPSLIWFQERVFGVAIPVW